MTTDSLPRGGGSTMGRLLLMTSRVMGYPITDVAAECPIQ